MCFHNPELCHLQRVELYPDYHTGVSSVMHGFGVRHKLAVSTMFSEILSKIGSFMPLSAFCSSPVQSQMYFYVVKSLHFEAF